MKISTAVFLIVITQFLAFINAADPITDVILNLYTRKNPTVPQRLINGNDTSINQSNYDGKKSTKMLVHGLVGRPDDPDNGRPVDVEFINACLNASDVNVIMVNWTAYATGPESIVLENAPRVGMWLGSVLDWLSFYGPFFSNLHMIGISLGSHVVGIAARNATMGVVDYITVCDPSRRSWDNNPEAINANDAVYVEAIHSENGTHGLRGPLGDTDFYPNGGVTQPGCPNQDCSHIRAFFYFIESIDNEFFKAKQCKGIEEIDNGSCSDIASLHMGGFKPKYNRTGIYYLETNAEKPFHKE